MFSIRDSETFPSIPGIMFAKPFNVSWIKEATGWVIKYPEKRRRMEATGKTIMLATRLVIQVLKTSFLPGKIPLRSMRGERTRLIKMVT